MVIQLYYLHFCGSANLIHYFQKLFILPPQYILIQA